MSKTVIRFIVIFILVSLSCQMPGSRGNNQEQEGPAPTTTVELQQEEAPVSEEAQAQEMAEEDVPAEYLDRYQIIQEEHPKALCNDGTTPVFYYRAGVGSGVNKWVIWFKGGGTGYSEETMKSRGPTITSSDPWMKDDFSTLGSGGNQGSPDGEAGGIMSSIPEDNPDFYNWNHVYLVYCSSDGWTGTREASPATGNIHFAGHYIVDAMFDALGNPDVIGSQNLSNATDVILSGSSAGALGLRSNVDRLVDMLQPANVKAISDAGVFMMGEAELAPIVYEVTKQQYQAWQSVLDDECEHENADEPWLCLSGSFLVQSGYISTPMFVHQDQQDIKLVEALTAMSLDVDQNLMWIGEATRPFLEMLDGVFSPIQGRHIIINTNRFNHFKLEGYSFAEIFGNWYFSRSGPTQLIEYP